MKLSYGLTVMFVSLAVILTLGWFSMHTSSRFSSNPAG
jgi:hypothetical protein